MTRFLRVEWRTIREKRSLRKVFLAGLLYLAVFTLMPVLMRTTEDFRYFFPPIAIMMTIATIITLYEEHSEQPLRRLLPSLPFTRSDIYLGRTAVKLLIWVISLPVSYLYALALDPLLGTAPSLPVFLIGAGFSFLMLSLEHLTLRLNQRWAGAMVGGFLGGSTGLFLSSSPLVFRSMLETDPSGIMFLLAFLAAGTVLLLLNKRWYERSAL